MKKVWSKVLILVITVMVVLMMMGCDAPRLPFMDETLTPEQKQIFVTIEDIPGYDKLGLTPAKMDEETKEYSPVDDIVPVVNEMHYIIYQNVLVTRYLDKNNKKCSIANTAILCTGKDVARERFNSSITALTRNNGGKQLGGDLAKQYNADSALIYDSPQGKSIHVLKGEAMLEVYFFGIPVEEPTLRQGIIKRIDYITKNGINGVRAGYV
ncbi:MAG: hypothetical protein ACM3PP_11085 [Candidatus Saccharibacteria bacterium]